MIEVTAKATEAIVEYLQDKKKKPVRVFLRIGGCGIRSFGLVLEDALPSDRIFTIDGISYTVNRLILEKYGPIKIDSDGFSFRLSGNGVYPPSGCGTCGYGCGSRGGAPCTGVCASCENPCPTGQRIKFRRTRRNSIGYGID